MANGSKDKEAPKDPILSVAVKQSILDAIDRYHHSDPAAPSWSYSVREVLIAGLKALGYPVAAPAREGSDPEAR